MALDKLPPELLHFIAQDLPTQSDRLALILSCRRFREILLIPTFYSKVTLFRSIENHKWYKFIRTIAQNLTLAEAVRELFVYSTNFCDEDIENLECDPNLTSQLLDDITLSDDERNKWEKDVNTGNPDVWLGLLLPQLPNLRRIDIVISHGMFYFHQILRKAALGNVRGFSKLEEAYVTWYDTKYGVASVYLMPFFYFPNMRKLGGSKIQEHDPDDPESQRAFTRGMDPLPPLIESSGITHLDFEDSNNTEDGMTHLIGSCKALKSFRLGYGGVMVSEEEFHPRALVESLKRHHKTSLERLWLDVDCEDEIEEDELVGSLAEFTALKYLHIRLPDLLDFDDELSPNALKDVLPPYVTTLDLSYCEEIHLQHLPEQLDELIQSRRESQLVKLDIQGDEDVPQTDPLVEQMRAMCSAAGIRLKFVAGMYGEESIGDTWPPAFVFENF